MQNNKFIFIPGGPGLNSFPEQNLLKEIFLANGMEGVFWNEPSDLREGADVFHTEQAFTRWKQSLQDQVNKFDEKVIIIASSFGALGCLHCLDDIESKIEKIVFISPAIFLQEVYSKMMKLASEDFKSLGHTENHALLEAYLHDTQSLYDEPMKAGLELTFQDPKLFLHYWRDHNKLASWAKLLEPPEYQLDFKSQDAVLSELKKIPFPLTTTYPNLKLDICVGADDPVYLKEKNEQLLSKHFPNITYHLFKESAHFPHIEEKNKFIQVIKS